jgi:hypothetical protein
MNLASSISERANARRHAGQARFSMILFTGVLSAVIAGAAVYYWMHSRPAVRPESTARSSALSESSLAVIQHLTNPVEIRFYSILDPASVPQPLRDYATRVAALLSQYELESNGKLRVTRHADVGNDEDARRAAADQITPFNLHLGNTCYFGIAVAQGEQKESLPQLSPEWEPALEADLSRAIARVSAERERTGTARAEPAADHRAALEQVRDTVPDLDSLTLDEAKKRLREKSFAEFKAAAAKLETELQAAQERVAAAHQSGSEADQQAALRALQQAQQAQVTQLKAIAAQSQAQVEALEQFKRAAQ